MKADTKRKAQKRLRIIEGQVRGLSKMIEEERYCIDIIDQSNAVKEALSKVEQLLLEHHLSTHVLEQMRNGQQKKAIDEIMSVYRVSKRNSRQ